PATRCLTCMVTSLGVCPASSSALARQHTPVFEVRARFHGDPCGHKKIAEVGFRHDLRETAATEELLALRPPDPPTDTTPGDATHASLAAHRLADTLTDTTTGDATHASPTTHGLTDGLADAPAYPTSGDPLPAGCLADGLPSRFPSPDLLHR